MSREEKHGFPNFSVKMPIDEVIKLCNVINFGKRIDNLFQKLYSVSGSVRLCSGFQIMSCPATPHNGSAD
jgi:hypothetical protein